MANSIILKLRQDISSSRKKYSLWDYTKLTEHLFLGQGLIQSIQLDGSGYRVEHQGVKGLRLFAYGQDMMLWTTVDDGRSCCMD